MLHDWPSLAYLLGVGIPFSLSFTRLFRGALDFARFEENRLTPSSPWFFFDHYIGQHRRDLIYIVLIPLLAPISTMLILGGTRGAWPWEWPYIRILNQSYLLWFFHCSLASGSAIIIMTLAPRLRSIGLLTALAQVGGIVALIAALFVTAYLMHWTPVTDFPWLYLRVRDDWGGGYIDIPLLLPPILCGVLGIAPAYWKFLRWIRGEKWFRLETR